MVRKIEEIKIINIDNVPLAVSSLSAEIQQLVEIYNDWTQQEVEARDKLIMLQSAKNDLSRQIITQYQKEKAEKAPKAVVPTPPQTQVQVTPVDKNKRVKRQKDAPGSPPQLETISGNQNR